MHASPTPVIEVYADIWCPFTHVGLRAAAEQRARVGRADMGIRVRAWPLELVNGAPLDPMVTRDHVDELREQVAPGLFADFDPDHFPRSTLDALALANRAYRTDPAVGERMSLAIRDALFEEGRDISDPATLEEIRRDLGVGAPEGTDRDEVLADWHGGQERGVLGSPHFFCGEDDVFCPTLDISRDPVTGLTVTRDASRLTAFLGHCLGGGQ